MVLFLSSSFYFLQFLVSFLHFNFLVKFPNPFLLNICNNTVIILQGNVVSLTSSTLESSVEKTQHVAVGPGKSYSGLGVVQCVGGP